MRRAVEGIITFAADQAIKTRRRPARLVLIPYNHLVRPALLRLLPLLTMRRTVEGIITFAADQAIKTRRRPARLVLIPYNHLVRPALLRLLPLLHFGPLAAAWFLRCLQIPTRWIPKKIPFAEASYYFHRGQELLSENKPEDSWLALEKCIKYSKDYFHFMMAGVCLHVGLGRMREAIRLYRQSNRLRLAAGGTAVTREYDRYCVLDNFWAAHIGHAAQIDYMVKLRMLEGRDPSDTILYVPHIDKVANGFLVRQWSRYLQLITDPRDLPFPEEHVKYLAVDFYVPGGSGVGRYFLWELAAQTYRRWEADGRKPLLALAEDVQDRGRKALESAGMPRDAWYVGVHVREPQYQNHHRGLHGVLNAKIQDYLPAIEEIVRRGGWVIRMGDPLMTPLPPLPNVLDYCHSAIRSDWMDVFLAATSRFFVGTSSGLCYVAQDYGVPSVLTNWWPPAQRPWLSGDIFIPKLLRRIRSGRLLSLARSLNEPFGYCNSVDYLRERHGVTVQDNDPEDIRAAVVEMLDRLDGRLVANQTDIAIRKRAETIYASAAMKLYDSPGAFGAGVLARDFLKRNPSFIGT